MNNVPSNLENKINSLFDQAYALLQEGNYDDAEYDFKQILKLDQNNPDALHLLGILNYQTGHMDESLKYLNKAITVKPSNASYCNDIALVYDHIGMVGKANKFFKKAIQLEPDNPAFLFNIGNLLLNTGNEKDAVVYYKKAIEINNENAFAYNNLGQALHRLHDVESAERAYREAIKINANFASAHNNLGTLLQDRGDFNGAMDSYIEALRCDPDMVMACSNIAYLKKCNSPDDEIIYKLINLFEKDGIDIEDEIVISFALGKLYDDCSEYEKAFKNYERGNLLAGMDADFDKDFYIAVIDTIKNSFDQNFFNSFGFNGNSSDKPVFIVGMPRSGTSLVEQIISSHTMAAVGNPVLLHPGCPDALRHN